MMLTVNLVFFFSYDGDRKEYMEFSFFKCTNRNLSYMGVLTKVEFSELLTKTKQALNTSV